MLSYLRATPRLMRFILDDQGRGSELPLPAHTSRSQVSASLHHLGHVASGVLAHGSPCAVCIRLPPDHSFRWKFQRFQQPEEGSCRLPFSTGLSQYGTVSQTTYRQALAGLFVVELFAATGLSGVPDSGQRIGSACHQVRGSPRRPRLNEPDETFTRLALRLWSEPPERDFHPLELARPLSRSVLVAPLSVEGKSASDRTSGLVCVGQLLLTSQVTAPTQDLGR
jgi:hypothetical protein